MCISNMATRALTAGQMMQAFGQQRTAPAAAQAAQNTRLGRAISRSGKPDQQPGQRARSSGTVDRNKSVMY